MATYNLQAGTPDIELVAGMKLRLESIHPTAGTAIATVATSAWAIYGDDLSGFGVEAGDLGPYMFVPGPDEA